jgi:hypothetical protein
MVRWMKAIITQIESVVTPSGNSGHNFVIGYFHYKLEDNLHKVSV